MERLTKPDEEIHNGWKVIKEDPRYIKGNAIKIYSVLKAYEDTGLTPPEIMDLKERDTAKAPVQYGDEDEPVFRCQHCDENVTDLIECGFNFCPYCGGKWED